MAAAKGTDLSHSIKTAEERDPNQDFLTKEKCYYHVITESRRVLSKYAQSKAFKPGPIFRPSILAGNQNWDYRGRREDRFIE